VASSNGQITTWNLSAQSPYLSSDSILWSKTVGVSAEHLAYDSKVRLLVAWSDNSQIGLFDIDSGSKVRDIEVRASALCTSPLGGLLFVAIHDQLVVYDITTGLPLRSFTTPEIRVEGGGLFSGR